jgi:hypothetical protein
MKRTAVFEIDNFIKFFIIINFSLNSPNPYMFSTVAFTADISAGGSPLQSSGGGINKRVKWYIRLRIKL